MNCETIQELLLDGALEDAQHQVHVEGCAECGAFARSLLAIDVGLTALPEVAAPEPLVQRTLETVHALEEPTPSVLGALGAQLGRGALAVVELVVLPFKALGKMRGPKLGLVLGAPALLALFVGMSWMSMGRDIQAKMEAATSPINGLPGEPVQSPSFEAPLERSANRYGIEGPATIEPEVIEGEAAALGAIFGASIGDTLDEDSLDGDDGVVQPDDGWWDRGGRGRITIEGRGSSVLGEGQPAGNQEFRNLREDRQEAQGRLVPHGSATARSQPARRERDREASGERTRRAAEQTIVASDEEEQTEVDELRLRDSTTSRDQSGLVARLEVDGRFVDRREVERGELEGRDRVDALTFQPARGLWSNTYVPGDPRWRLLARQLRERSGTLSGLDVSAFELAQEAEPVVPRIAAPRQSALALSVQSDRAEIEGQTRVLMQVGLRAASSRGRRPTLRSVVVLDLRRALSDAEQAQVRGLLSAISRSRTGADRIGIMVAGPHGGWLVEPGPLRFGEVTVALRRAMAREGGAATDLDDALGTAIESVNQLSDADSPLGSGLVWMITPGLDDTRALEGAAHAGALVGVTTTTIGLSAEHTDALENVAMAGHGRRWIADADPAELVRSEIAAVSRVVARALRLNVKLAPGVRLVDVLGSSRLDAQSAQRARASERALDRQLASRLGITADREDDDDGISILIPAFYSDDTHTVLLDLVVDNAGPVADVSLRYKDLLRLDNTEANERMVLPRGNAQRGPAQRDVMRDWLAYETSVALNRAARLLPVDRGRALQQLNAARERIESVGAALRLPRAQVRAHATVCARFAEALQAGADASLMADSLRYASRRLLFGDPIDGSR